MKVCFLVALECVGPWAYANLRQISLSWIRSPISISTRSVAHRAKAMRLSLRTRGPHAALLQLRAVEQVLVRMETLRRRIQIQREWLTLTSMSGSVSISSSYILPTHAYSLDKVHTVSTPSSPKSDELNAFSHEIITHELVNHIQINSSRHRDSSLF